MKNQTLSVVFNNDSNFQDAKLWFDSKSKYCPDYFNSTFRSFEFECKDIDILEKAIEKELIHVGFNNFYFESL